MNKYDELRNQAHELAWLNPDTHDNSIRGLLEIIAQMLIEIAERLDYLATRNLCSTSSSNTKR